MISDRRRSARPAAPPCASRTVARHRRRHPHRAVHGVVLRHEARELVLQLGVGVGLGARRRRTETAQALGDVAREGRLRELAVARNVDADLGLLAHDLGDALAHLRSKAASSTGLPATFLRMSSRTSGGGRGCRHGSSGSARCSVSSHFLSEADRRVRSHFLRGILSHRLRQTPSPGVSREWAASGRRGREG